MHGELVVLLPHTNMLHRYDVLSGRTRAHPLRVGVRGDVTHLMAVFSMYSDAVVTASGTVPLLHVWHRHAIDSHNGQQLIDVAQRDLAAVANDDSTCTYKELIDTVQRTQAPLFAIQSLAMWAVMNHHEQLLLLMLGTPKSHTDTSTAITATAPITSGLIDAGQYQIRTLYVQRIYCIT
jgi:hypothetical protein